MAENILISVVVLNWNGLNYLVRTIPLLLDFEYPNYELILVDNGSTDESLAYLKQFDDKIKIIKNDKNLGYSQGKNIGVTAARGKYVLLLDEDIVISDRLLLGKLFDLMEKNQNIFNISLLLVDDKKKNTEYYGGFYSLYGLIQRPIVPVEKIINTTEDLLEIASPDGGALFFTKNIFEQVGGYDATQPYFCDVGDYGIRGVILTGQKNYLYTKTILIHLGIDRRVENWLWCWKYKYVFMGITKIFFKNYRFKNIILRYPIFLGFMVVKTIKQAIWRRSFRVVISFLESIWLTAMSMPEIFRSRQLIQRNRVVKEDIFLQVKVPDFVCWNNFNYLTINSFGGWLQNIFSHFFIIIKKNIFLLWDKPVLFSKLVVRRCKLLFYIVFKRDKISGEIAGEIKGIGFKYDFRKSPDYIRRIFFNTYEPELIEFMTVNLFSGDTFVDVGANVGYLSAVAMGLVGKDGWVFSFEPVPEYYAKLRETMGLNPDYNLVAVDCACGDQPEKVRIVLGNTNIGWNTMVPDFMPSREKSRDIIVEQVRLDDYLLARQMTTVKMIKIDVEGYEFKVLRGLEKFLRSQSSKALIVCEIIPRAYPLLDHKVTDLLDFMASFGYRPYSLTNQEKIVKVEKLSNNINVVFIAK